MMNFVRMTVALQFNGVGDMDSCDASVGRCLIDEGVSLERFEWYVICRGVSFKQLE